METLVDPIEEHSTRSSSRMRTSAERPRLPQPSVAEDAEVEWFARTGPLPPLKRTTPPPPPPSPSAEIAAFASGARPRVRAPQPSLDLGLDVDLDHLLDDDLEALMEEDDLEDDLDDDEREDPTLQMDESPTRPWRRSIFDAE